MKKRFFALLVATAIAATSLVGCGTGKPNTAGKDDAKTECEELRFLDVNPSPQRQKYFEDTFEKFKEETGIKVSYESVPWDDAINKITVLGTSKQLPDVITIHPNWTGQLIESDWIVPIDEYVDEHEDEYTEVVKKVIWDAEKNNFGHTYTIPDGFMVKGIFYRKDWVKELNYEIPTGDEWTYDAYFDLIKALTDKEQKRYGNSFRGARGGFDPAMYYMVNATEGYLYDEEGNCLLNKPEGVEAFKKWCDIYKEGYVPEDSINWGFVEMVDNFTGGLTGTLCNDSEVVVACEEKMDPDQWGVLPVPKSDDNGVRVLTAGASYAYAVSAQSKYSEEAMQLIDFMVQPENNIEYCKTSGMIPIKKDVADDELYGENGPYAAFVSQLNDPDVVILPTSNYGPFNYSDLHQDMFHAEMQKYLLGKQTAQESIDNISNELTKRMKAYLAENEGSKIDEPVKLK